MAKRIIIRLSDEKEVMLAEMMREDNEADEPVAPYIARLISKEKTRRDELKNKRPVGRPKKEEENHEDYDWEGPVYYHPGKMLNQEKGELVVRSEYESYYIMKNQPIPEKPDKKVD